MMICIECGSTVHSLYQTYDKESHYITLTFCSKCNKIADKYIEHDNVLLAIDLLLLKPQAYRHIVFNVLENVNIVDGDGDGKYAKRQSTGPSATAEPPRGPMRFLPGKFRRWWVPAEFRFPPGVSVRYWRHPVIWKIWVLLTLFDVYLTWTQQEKQAATVRNHFMGEILHHGVVFQYLFFLIYCILDEVVTLNVIQTLASRWLLWGQQRDLREEYEVRMVGAEILVNGKASGVSGVSIEEVSALLETPETPEVDMVKKVPGYAHNVLSTAILIASYSKMFPILMVIWPYDVPLAASAVNFAVGFTVVEALTIMLNCSYLQATALTLAAWAVSAAVTNAFLALVVLVSNPQGWPALLAQQVSRWTLPDFQTVYHALSWTLS